MSRATRHIDRLLKALQSENSAPDVGQLGGSGARDETGALSLSDISGPQPAGAGSDDPLNEKDNVTPRSSARVSAVSTSSESDDLSTSGGGGGGFKYYREENARLVQQLGDSRVQVATLEAQVELLTHKVEERETVDSLYIHRLEEEVLRLEETFEQEMCNLSQRQNQIEKEVHPIEDQLAAIKDALHNFDIAEPMYSELKAIPEQRRTSRDHILIMAYEKHQHTRVEIQELRKSLDTSREALTRASDEVQKLTRELQRASVNRAADRRESELDLSAHSARVERLEAELRDSLVQVQVLTAKGALFDEVQAKLETLERSSIDGENQKAVMAATLQVAIQEKESLRESLKEKDHTLDLLSMDKIYLTKEVQCLAEQVRKLEAELERQHEKLKDVKRARNELYNKVIADNKDSQTANEQRLQAEISRIQERTNQDVEKIRREATAVADEKVGTFREMRDEALATAEMCRAELRDSKAAYEELHLKFRELQRVTDSKEAETRSNLKVTNFEVDRLKVVLDETKNALEQTRLENETWVAKVKVLKEKVEEDKSRSIEELKKEQEKPVSELKEELRVTRAQLEAYEKERIQQLKVEQSKLARKSPLETVSETTSRQKLASKSTDHRKLIQGSSSGSSQETKQLEEQLRSVTEEKDRVSSRLKSVQDDIRKLLRARGSVEQLQSLLKEKGVSVGGSGSSTNLKSIKTRNNKTKKSSSASRSISPKISPPIRGQSSTPTKKDGQIQSPMVEEDGETRQKCEQHRSCSPHYPKVYDHELVDAMGTSKRAPAPSSQDQNPSEASE